MRHKRFFIITNKNPSEVFELLRVKFSNLPTVVDQIFERLPK